MSIFDEHKWYLLNSPWLNLSRSLRVSESILITLYHSWTIWNRLIFEKKYLNMHVTCNMSGFSAKLKTKLTPPPSYWKTHGNLRRFYAYLVLLSSPNGFLYIFNCSYDILISIMLISIRGNGTHKGLLLNCRQQKM